MSRSAHQRQQQKLQMQQQQLLAQQMADNEAAAAAAEMFDLFCVATTMRQILGLHRQMCDVIGLRPAPLNDFYPKLKTKVRSWKAQALWKKFDARAAHRAYAKGTACTGTRVLVIGAGPCGLRTAIEAQLLGAKVVVVEKRDRISRNNVLHLWPFVITDLRNLGAKKFYGKFCAGSIDHISIRQLQCILLKVALLLGVEIHEGVSFDRTIEPSGDGCGWRAQVSPADHAVSHYEFDVLIGADGKRNTLEGFKRKEFRGKLAIAITANFINKKTEAEAKAEEISGVAFIFNQSFFKELYHTTGIDLENIVYYKDETHYFVMTAKKHSLIDKGVILQDFADPAELLASINVNTEKLLDYAREAAEFSTKYQMPNLEFAVNHYGKPDVAMFDFTSMFAAESSCRVIVRHGFRLLQCLVGDSLLEPFWPTGSGCARGFLSSMDAAYVIKLWTNPANSTLGVMAQRESIYRLLGQTTPENLQRDIGSYTVDPATRYPNLNRSSVNVWQVKHLIDTDDKSILEQTFMDTNALQVTQVDTPVRRKRRSGDTMPLSAVLLRWTCAQLHSHDFSKDLKEVSDIFTNGKVLCALINRYRPDLVDFNAVKDLSPVEMNDLAFKILDKELHIPRIMSGKDSIQLNTVESKVWLSYLEQICEVFRGEIPHIKHPKIDFSDLREKYRTNNAYAQPDFSKLLQLSSKQKAKSPIQDAVDVPQVVQRRSVLDEEKLKRQRRHEQLLTGNAAGAGHAAQTDTPRRAKKRRSAEKAANIEERQQRLQEIEQNRSDRLSKRRQQRYQQTQNFYKSLHMLQANNLLRESDENTPFEDYSIFMYRQQAPEFNDRVKDLERKLLYPDRERGDIQSAFPRGNLDEQFSDRIKSMEQRITSRNNCGTEKKPKDLMRAIGKIDSNDWNVREIEKKIEQSKKTEVHGPKGREKVPKWSKEQFQARQHKMSKPHRQDSAEEKFKEIDQTLKTLDKQLKEGSVLEVGERGRNKVASIAGQFKKRDDVSEEKTSPTVASKSSSKVALAFKKQAASEKCHFCRQTVYLMEKLQTENLVMHRGCLKCHHCHTNLRLGAYAFDRDDPNGRFYCTQHFRLPAKPTRPAVRRPGQRKPTQQQQNEAAAAAASETVDSRKAVQEEYVNSESGEEPKIPDKRGPVDNVTKLDLLERGQTPERIEFENTDAMSDGEPSEEHIIDEHEWSGRNFLPESNNDSESDLSSSDESDTESDSDLFEEANDSPLGAQTLQLASEWIGKQNYSDSDDSDEFYDSSEGLADDGKDDTEGEEFEKARELRREEVRLPPLPPNLPTDTETENKSMNFNKENMPNDNEQTLEKSVHDGETVPSTEPNTNNLTVTALEMDNKKRKGSNVSAGSDQSFKSTSSFSLANSDQISPLPPTTKADIEKMEQISGRKFSSEIDAISEKLYHLNNVVKMNKDIETIAKENLIRSDILKKLSMKEKWLADKQIGVANPIVATTQFEQKVDKILQPPVKSTNDDALLLPKSKFNDQKADPYAPKSQFKDVLIKPGSTSKDVELSQDNKLSATHGNKSKESSDQDSANVLQQIRELINKENMPSKKTSKKTASRSNSFKSNASGSSPLVKPKSIADVNAIKNDNKMEIENILNIVKNIEISKSESAVKDKSNSTDIGKLLYKVETKFSPKPNRRMSEKLKEIEAKSFSGTLDSIKSQMEVPTVSAQAVPPNVDLSKYFPNQKQEKASSSQVNKNQKALNEIDLTKYFPSSPIPQRRASVVTVADKLRQCQTAEKSLASLTKAAANESDHSKGINSKRQQPPLSATTSASSFSLKDNQLDGAIDIVKMKPSAKVVTTAAVATTAKKGKNVKIIKKIVRKGSMNKNKSGGKSIIPRDDDDLILDEILNNDNEELRSPSLEYQQLFQEEKSPSEDISDKIELILEETGIDLGISKQSTTNGNAKKKLIKAKSFAEGELQCKANNVVSSQEDNKEEGDIPSGVQNILKRFESMSSVPNEEHSFKLRRMESTTSNLNKSKESIMSRDSETLSDLEKTMEYLKSEWQNEATNFLQKKRNDFNKKKTIRKIEPLQKTQSIDIGTTDKESKFAKFFGLKQKSPEKRKSPNKKRISPEKKKKQPLPSKTSSRSTQSTAKTLDVEKKVDEPSLAKTTTNNKPIVYASLEELALVSVSDQVPKTTKKEPKLIKQDELHKVSVSEQMTKPKQREPENIKGDNETQEAVVDATNNSEDSVAKRPLVEDIRNLPKTGCDKSLSSSRRGSQTSLQSRRLSNTSNTEKIEMAIESLNSEIGSDMTKPIMLNENYDEDSLCTSISKSPSIPPPTVQLRGSSEDESIENLFSQFSDEMLVNVEFDSNDELIEIIPVTEESNDNSVVAETNKSETFTDTNIEYENELNKTKTTESASNAKLHVPLHTISIEANFPIRPQRRQKSKSSSSDSTTPLPPQRIKKKLSKLSPSDMPPSVQDLMQEVYKINDSSPQPHLPVQTTQSTAAKSLRFPRMIDEDDILLDDMPFGNKLFINNLPNYAPATRINDAEDTQEKPVASVSTYLKDGFESRPVNIENVTEFTKVLKPIEHIGEETLTLVQTGDAPNKLEETKVMQSSLNEASAEWNMEMIPNSPMPRHKSVQAIANAPVEDNSREMKKLDWNMEMLPNSPMPRRKSSASNNSSVQNEQKVTNEISAVVKSKTNENLISTKQEDDTSNQPNNTESDNSNQITCSESISIIREKSPTSSIKVLNTIDVKAEDSQKRLIEEFELERRQALIERDKHYNVMEKKDVKPPLKKSGSGSGSNSSKITTPLSTPSKQSPRGSRRSSQQSSSYKREGTPPMTKPLEIPTPTTAQSSRRSSFAFIELLDSKPIVAPLPKKLELPKLEDKIEIPDNLTGPMPEEMKNRPWPKSQDIEDTDNEGVEYDTNANGAEIDRIEYANIKSASGPKRDWPDGKTIFSKNKTGKSKTKPRSETPEVGTYSFESKLERAKPSSKSTTDLTKLSTPYTSNHSLATTAPTQRSMSSNDSEYNYRADKSLTPQRPSRQNKLYTTSAGVDASTQMLLERSKRLHNRKRDFVNERVVERNPYMREVVDAERRGSYGGTHKNDSDDEDIGTYRPRHYSSVTNSSRFPSSRALGRPHISQQHYDYVPTYVEGSSVYSGGGGNRRLPTVTPLSSLHSNYSYKPYTTSSLGYSTGRTSYLNDFSRRSPSQLRDRSGELSKDSCVQSESESSSSDEIEPNSATEISTDSEFDNDEMIRCAPKIFIDDTHLRKPTKVQVKSTIIPPSVAQKYNNAGSGQQKATAAAAGTYLAKYQQPHAPIMPQFKPLVQVDPSLLTGNRTPLQNPRPGDYLLNKTASTEGIASKKSLELKKRYLLGEPANGNKIQKSGSTSVLDSRIRSFQSNISECQKLLNPSSDISATMKTFLDRTKLGEKASQQELMRSATNNILNDLKVEITIQKASSAASTDNEKENVFVNSKNELNKCMEYSETVNPTSPLLDSVTNKISPTTPTNNRAIIETIDLVTPEKDESRDKSDSNKVIDLTGDSPEKSNRTQHENVTKPDVSRDVIQCIPDILGHIEEGNDRSPCVATDAAPKEEEANSYENNVEKSDSPEKAQIQNDTVEDVQIEVPNIEWNTHKSDNLSLSSNSSCSSHSSSLEDIEHYILESTTSPETNNSAIAVISSSSTGNHQVPRVEVHDSSGTLMQIDSLMIIDGKYIGDPEDLKYMELPEGIILPELPAIKTSELDDDHELDPDQDPVTSTPEPIEATVIEASTDKLDEEEGDDQPPPLPENGPPLPEKGPPRFKPSNLKFDTRNENKIESLKNLPLIVDTTTVEHTKAVKPITLNISTAQKVAEIKVSQQQIKSPTSPFVDFDKTPTGDVLSRGSDSETEPTGTAQILTETELSDWTADDCISENFIDMDFVNKALKGKSHKRGKRTTAPPIFSTGNRLPSTDEVMQAVANTAPVAEFEGILKSIDLDDIEFMDTGSESSDTEPHSATNTALLRNKGYVEFVDHTTAKNAAHLADNIVESSKTQRVYESYKGAKMRRDEKLGIDYIEQGAYIMHDDANKTPVNEASHCIGTSEVTASYVMTQSLTDSSTINDIEDDSTNSQLQLSSAGTGDYLPPNSVTVTTEESEALTVVSSPLDSSSPQTRNSIGGPKNDFIGRGTAAADCASTPSSSDRAPKTSQSTTRSNSGTSSSKNTPPRQSSKDSNNIPLPGDRRSNDELSYEEYVRALQQKIVQISTTARGDSLEMKKQRRKSSKGEVPTSGTVFTNPNQTVIETTTPTNLRFDANDDETAALQLQTSTNNAKTSTIMGASTTQHQTQQQLNKVPEIPTLTRKLEEITKERTKQKDLIHDLVMDKLQSKKQLNAEKRLHRSRQRSMITGGTSGVVVVGGGGYSSGSSLSPTPKLAAANSTTDANCTNQAHYHVSTAATATSPSARTAAATQRFLSNSSSFKENNPSPAYVSTYGAGTLSPTRANAYKQRPFSEHLESEQIAAALEHRYKINKTPSFSYTTGSQHIVCQPVACPSAFSTPIPPTRHNRGRPAAVGAGPTPLESNKDINISTSTENLRSEARARARLKSNSELGLSPEEKMQLLRKRIQTEHSGSSAKGNEKEGPNNTSYDRQTSIRESKMNASKSVNDLAYLANSQKHNIDQTDDSPSSTTSVVKSDFTSDPNILLSSTQSTSISCNKLMKTSRRPKDPERRKSLIQSLSNFFHKGQQCKERGKDVTTTSDGNSAQTEQPGTGSSGGGGGSSIQSTSQAMSGIDGVLSRFRISPKSKEKSRSCFELRNFNNGDKDDYTADGSSTRRLRTSSACLALSYEPHKHHSQDALSPRSHLTHTPHSHSQLNSLNYNSNSISKSCKRNSSSQRSHLNHHTQQNNFQGLCSSKNSTKKSSSSSALAYSSSSPQLSAHKSQSMTNTSNATAAYDDQTPPPIPPLPLNYQRSDDESYSAETRDQKKQRAISKAVRQAELKRLRIAQEIQREQEEIEVQLKELETRGVLIEKALRGEEPNLETTNNVGSNDEKLLKELLEIWRNITQLKKRDEELGIRQQELQLEHRHAQLKEELNMRLSCNKLDKSSADVAAEGAILNEMLEIVAKRAALRPSASTHDLVSAPELLRSGEIASCSNKLQLSSSRGQSHDIEESNI